MRWVFLILMLIPLCGYTQKKFDNMLTCINSDKDIYKKLAKSLLSRGISLAKKDKELGYIKSDFIKNKSGFVASSKVSYVFSIDEGSFTAFIQTKVNIRDAIINDGDIKNDVRRMGFALGKNSHPYKAFDRLVDVISDAGGCSEWRWSHIE